MRLDLDDLARFGVDRDFYVLVRRLNGPGAEARPAEADCPSM